MATLEKPKKEKTKRAKVKQKPDTQTFVDHIVEDDLEIVEKVEASTSQQSDKLDLDQFAQMTVCDSKDIVSHECYISSEYIESDDKKEVDVVENADLAENISIHDEIIQATAPLMLEANTEVIGDAKISTDQAVTPTAPPADKKIAMRPIVLSSPVLIQYPNLQPLQVETKMDVVFKIKSPGFCLAKSHLKPYTLDELKQIYYCQELDLVQQFELEFLMNSLLETQESDPLYAALLEYYNLQSKLSVNLHDIKKQRENVLSTQENIWIEIPMTKTFTSRCSDNIEVSESITYNIAQVDGKCLENASNALGCLFDLVCYSYTTNSITAKTIKVKIDEIINGIIGNPHVSALATNAKITLHKSLDEITLQYVSQLRRAISIAFSFIRKISPNATFDADLKMWLRKLISLHLRLATREDHWFLLFNILRCPIGVGLWAKEFLQVPTNSLLEAPTSPSSPHEIPLDLNSIEMSHCVAVLKILLLPIKKRNEYLKAFTQSHKEICDPVQEERWILIDSDGEDSHTSSGECIGLKESDLIALLNQIPFEKLFISTLGIEKFLGDYILQADDVSAARMLKVIVFFAQLIEICGEGMLTYNTERYKQLAKRLGRLIRHILQYASDYHEIFSNNNQTKDAATCERISVELDALLMKACNYIYRTRNLATWQYFASLPYSALDASTIWQIFYFLNLGFPTDLPTHVDDPMEEFSAPDFWLKFNVANADSSAEDLYYLLQAFFEMANERDKVKDWELIKAICLHIFNIGYLNKATREVCYKASRDMLVNLTLAYEDLISCLLLQAKVRFTDIENVMYLFKSLPLENWKPSMDSFEILSNWLLHFDFKSKENMLARIVISHLHWGFDCDNRLFLPHNIHVRMACLVTEALTKHAPEVVGLSGISESVRQISSLVDFTQSTKEQFTTWCWSMVSILRLHLMDLGVESVKRTLQNPTEPLMFVPELERTDLIYQGVTENRPLALFVAILVTLHGHSIPLICQKGFDLMKLLLQDFRHAAVIRCIELIVPLFLETPETLAHCESLHSIFNSLLNADRTYLRMAKDMIQPNSIGPVLELLDNMIHHQITSYTDYGLSTPLNMINVWLNCLTSLPNWPNTSVVYLLDKILRVAYQFPDARIQAVEFFQNYYKDFNDWKGTTKSTLKSLFTSAQTRVPALSANQPWLALVLLEIEFNAQDVHFWPELLRQLSMASGKMNVESVLKKTSGILKLNAFPAHMLVIYKYANVAANMDIAHPLFPIVLQKFFELYLCRVPHHYDEHNFQAVYSVTDKFYDFNAPLMKKIKTNIKAAKTYYKHEATKSAAQEGLSYVYRDCASIMSSYELWLEETTINRLSVDQLNFPPQYNNEKLRELLSGNTPHWTEYIYLPAIRKEQRQQADNWARKCYRAKTTQRMQTALQPRTRDTPMERIKRQLGSYDKSQPAPDYITPTLYKPKQINGNTLNQLKTLLSTLTSTATKFHFQTCELNSLNRNYLDIVLNLYKMVPYTEIKYKTCSSLLFNRNCKEAAKITATIEQKRMDEAVNRKIISYRERHNRIIDDMLELNAEDFAQGVQQMSEIIEILLGSQMNEATRSKVVTQTGIQFFYALITNMSDITMKFTPTNDHCNQLLNELGVFIQENQEDEGLNILKLALKRPDLLKVFGGVFVPYRTQPKTFLKMYKFLIDSYLKSCDTKILFVLFSKFDLVKWLEAFQPKLYDINQLLQMVLDGLESWSQPDSSLLQDQFRRHLVHIFSYDFPQHYGEVMQLVLDRISDQKLMPLVLCELLNSLLQRFNCVSVDLNITNEQIEEIAVDFARRQNLFNLKAATDTVMLFARHFQKERLHHGLHGLYPKHKDYCRALAMWFSCFGHTVIVTAICTYQELLADQISDVVFGTIIEMYSPWLIVYTAENMQQMSSNWIRQLTDSSKQMLNPWSEKHAGTSKVIIKAFINTLNFILDYLPISDKTLQHVFSWYIHHFTLPKMEQYVLVPIHEGLSLLAWERFKPLPNYIDMLYDSLQKFIPGAHAMLGHIFIRLDWNAWFAEKFPTFPVNVQTRTISRVFCVFIKLAFEPNIHIHVTTSKILEDAMKYPWHLIEYAELESLLTWFVSTVDPSIILKIPTESNYADRAVLDLLRFVSGMMPEQSTSACFSNVTAKRILYTRSMVRLMRACAAKNQKLLATKAGPRIMSAALMDLLRAMDNTIQATNGNKTLEEQRREAANLMIEVIVPMQTQSEETSNLHVDTIIEYAHSCQPGNLLVCSSLQAIGHMKTFISSVYTLLEASIGFYFCTSDETKDVHMPSWLTLLQTLQMSLEKLELMPIMRGPYCFTLHIYILYKLEKIQNVGDKITFLQDVSQLIGNLKSSQSTESRLAIVWGVIISCGCKVLAQSEHAKKPLLMLARHLQMISTEAEGWGDGILGAIGLKKDIITNRRKILTRCLACVIYSLFPIRRSDESQGTCDEFESALHELTALLANKKFIDEKPLIVNAINVISEQKMPIVRDAPHLICRLIALCYNDNFLMTIPEVWDFDFTLI